MVEIFNLWDDVGIVPYEGMRFFYTPAHDQICRMVQKSYRFGGARANTVRPYSENILFLWFLPIFHLIFP